MIGGMQSKQKTQLKSGWQKWTLPIILQNRRKMIMQGLLLPWLMILSACSMTSPKPVIIPPQKIQIVCPSPPAAKMITPPQITPTAIKDQNGQWWAAFSPQDGERLVLLIANTAEHMRQAKANQRYFVSCINSFNED